MAEGAYTAVMGTEFQQLSHRKSDNFKYLDRQTAQWLEKNPSTKSEANIQPRRVSIIPSFVGVTPTSKISPYALHAFPSERVCQLAQPRRYAPQWQPELPLPLPVSRASLTAVASSRICKLAQPKKRHCEVAPCPKSEPQPATHLTSAHLSHLSMLATPKAEHPLCQIKRSPRWSVSPAARSYAPSPRVLELSIPKIRKDVYDGYNPFVVSHAALCGTPSPRTLQLSLPLPRKCTPKAIPAWDSHK